MIKNNLTPVQTLQKSQSTKNTLLAPALTEKVKTADKTENQLIDKISSSIKAKNSFLTAGSQSMTKLEPLATEKAPKSSFLT